MSTRLYDNETFTVHGREFRVNYNQDEYAEAPWDNSCGHGVVRKSRYTHAEGSSDKRPGERPLNQAGRDEYQYYYDWQASIKTARADGWNTAPYEAPERAQRAAQADFDYLRGYLTGDWVYLIVTVTDLETDETESMGLVESQGDYASEVAHGLAKELYARQAIENRFADAMATGV